MGQRQASLEAGPPDGTWVLPGGGDDCLGPGVEADASRGCRAFPGERGRHGDLGAGLGPLGAVKRTLGALRAAGCCPCSVALGAGPHRLAVVEGPPPGLQPLGLLWDSRPWGRIGCPAPQGRCSSAGILHATPRSPSSRHCPSAGCARPSNWCSSGSDDLVFTAVRAGFRFGSPSVSLTPVCYRKGSSGFLRGGCAWDPGQQSWMGPLGSGQPAHLSPTHKFQVSWNQCHRSASSAELDSPGQPRSPAGTLTPLGVSSAELSLRVLSVVAIYYCHGHHMLDLSVSKTIKEIHSLLTYDRCKADCFLGSVLGANCGSSKSLFKASSFPQLLGAGLAQG